MSKTLVTRGLIVDMPWVEHILSDRKDWEMRSRATQVRGTIALIRKGTGEIHGLVDLVDVKGPFGRAELLRNIAHHQVPADLIKAGKCDNWPFAWVLQNVRRLKKPVPYRHPSGAVIWVTLDEAVQRQLAKAA